MKFGKGSTVSFALNKNGRLRFCVEYCRINTTTVKDSYPLPRFDECIETFGDSRIFTTLDVLNGYLMIEVVKENHGKTTLVYHEGHLQYISMPLGLTNEPETFQRGLDVILSRFK